MEAATSHSGLALARAGAFFLSGRVAYNLSTSSNREREDLCIDFSCQALRLPFSTPY